MNIDQEIDRFVAAINSAPREPGWEDEIPASVRTSNPDASGYFGWIIRSVESTPWVDELPGSVFNHLPPSYRSLITRYIFPGFEAPKMFLFGNTPEGSAFEFRSRLCDLLATELLAKRQLIQIGAPEQFNHDAICFDASGRSRKGEHPVVLVDHEDVLQERNKWKVEPLAESFLELIAV